MTSEQKPDEVPLAFLPMRELLARIDEMKAADTTADD